MYSCTIVNSSWWQDSVPICYKLFHLDVGSLRHRSGHGALPNEQLQSWHLILVRKGTFVSNYPIINRVMCGYCVDKAYVFTSTYNSPNGTLFIGTLKIYIIAVFYTDRGLVMIIKYLTNYQAKCWCNICYIGVLLASFIFQDDVESIFSWWFSDLVVMDTDVYCIKYMSHIKTIPCI